MPTRSELKAALVARLSNYPELAALYQAGDPRLTVQIGTIEDYLVLVGEDLDSHEQEPFTKTRERTILADTSAKGILPFARATQYKVLVSNSGTSSVTLSAGRYIKDGLGRLWRLLASVTVDPIQSNGQPSTALVSCEQSQLRTIAYTVDLGGPLHTARVNVTSGMYLCAIPQLRNASNQAYTYAPRWMNVQPDDLAFTLLTDSQRSVLVQWGIQGRVGVEAQTNDQYSVTVLETYGEVPIEQLNQASLVELLTIEERKIRISFAGGELIQSGANPPDLALLQQLANYPALYDENAVYLGNFDMLVRRFFGMRADFLSVWNEAIHELAFGSVDVTDINRLFVAVVPKLGQDLTTLKADISLKIASADSLYTGRVKFVDPVELAYPILITGRIAAVHSLDAVREQIKNALLAKYGKGQIAVSRPLANGLNLQQAAKLLREQVSAFQDNLSDFSISVVGTPAIYPNTWVYLTEGSISFNLSRSADEAVVWNQ